MSNDRRNDLGQKIMIGLVLGGFGTIMGFFVNTTYSVANEGRVIAYQNQSRITYLESKVTSIHDDLDEIKTILRRGVPRVS